VSPGSDAPLESAVTRSPAETARAAELFWRRYFAQESRALLLLEGDLGAGKTAFVRGLGAAMGVEDIVNSPTFNLLHIHRGRDGVLLHYDLYRLRSPQELEGLDFLERWSANTEGPRELHAIEWPSRAAHGFPSGVAIFRLNIDTRDDVEDERRLTLYRDA
jgi:tRNA threonylcarbamoyladenosine biosynthesis protein TsaE